MEGDLQMNFQNCNTIESWPVEELFIINPGYPYNMQVLFSKRRINLSLPFYNNFRFKRLIWDCIVFINALPFKGGRLSDSGLS